MSKRNIDSESDGHSKKRKTTSTSLEEPNSGELDMAGADFVNAETAGRWYSILNSLDTWYHPTLKVYGKEYKQSRSISAYCSEADMKIRYSGHTVDLHTEYPPIIKTIQNQIEESLGEKFNHVMLNRYQTGEEYIGRHRDTKQNRVIASLSLGAERTFIFTPGKKIASQGAEILKFKLGNGSLLVMHGDTQSNWTHEIPKEPKIREGRISLTFRQIQEV